MKYFLITAAFFSTNYCFSQIDINMREKPIKKSTNQALTIRPVNLYNFNNVKNCVDLAPLSSPLPPRAASNAYTIYHIDENGNLSKVAFQRQPLAAINDKMWTAGESLKVGFDIAGGNINMILKAQFYAKEWERIANIKLEFVPNMSDAVIRAGIMPGKSYSQIGRDALLIPANITTMNLGWLNSTDEAAIKAMVLHEFGHALGFIHEHQSPAATIPWDKEKVYAYYALPPNSWSKENVDQNVFAKMAVSSTNYSSYDPLSIMHYSIPPELTIDGSGTPFNLNYSATDRQYAALVYPFPPLPANAGGTLKTGDDCDEISFLIEYGAVPADQVEFRLEYGQNNNKKVTWWKQIGITRTNNTETLLAIQNHSLILSENNSLAQIQIPANGIQITKGISFWKAKAFGVHTPLSYKWNVLPAIRGGCRVKLIWKKDSCL